MTRRALVATTPAPRVGAVRGAMRVYADDSAEIVLRPGFLDIYPRGGAPRRLAWEEPPKKGASLGFARRRVLAVAGDHAWVGEGRGVRIVSLAAAAGHASAPLGVRVLDAIGLDRERIVLCAQLEGDLGACLRVVDGGAPDLAGAKPLELPSVPKIAWPAGAIWKAGKEAWSTASEGASSVAPGHPQRDGARFFDAVELTRSPYGIAGASVQNGLVFALADDASRIEAAFRVPSVPEAEIHPVRTADGILVTITIDGRDSALVHATLAGEVIAARWKIGRSVAKGMSPPLVFGETVFVFERGAGAFVELALASLEVKGKHKIPPIGGGQASVAFANGAALLSDGESAFRVTLEGGAPELTIVEAVVGAGDAETASAADALELEDDAGDADEDAEDDDDRVSLASLLIPASRPRAAGPPSLVLTEAATPSVWALEAGSALEVTVGFGNVGGASQGVYLEVAGPAIASGLASATEVRVGAQSARFEKVGSSYRAELPTLSLLAGLQPDPDDKRSKLPLYDGAHRAKVALAGRSKGAGLVTVRIGPSKAAPGRGSIVQGKTLAVR